MTSPDPLRNYAPAPRVHTPTPESEEMVLVRRTELKHLSEDVKNLQDTTSIAEQAMWATGGVGVGSAVAAVAMYAPGDPVDATVATIVICCAVAFIVFAAVLGLLAKNLRSSRKGAAERLATRIDEFDRRAPSQ